MDGLPSLFSSVKRALLCVEKAISPVSGSLPVEINKDVTDELRSFASLFAPVLDRFLVSRPGLDDPEPCPVAVEEEHEERYGCDDHVRDSLREFHDRLRHLWPVGCEAPHKLMLKLTAHRRHDSEPGGRQKVLALDTLSSGHDRHWGRIVFTLR